MRTGKIGLKYFDKLTNAFEIAIGGILLLVIAVKMLDLVFALCSTDIVLLSMEFEQILVVVFNLIIGVEFVRMLYKHTPETVIEVLLFAIARTMVLSNEGAVSLILGVASIAGLFAVKKYLIHYSTVKDKTQIDKL